MEEIEIPYIIDYDNDPEDPQDQLEMFVQKFEDVQRQQISTLLEVFRTLDIDADTFLEQDQCLRLWELQADPKTVIQFRNMVKEGLPLKKNSDRKLNFLEVATCFFNKSWEELHKFIDKKAYEEAMAKIESAQEKTEEAARALEELRVERERASFSRAQARAQAPTEVHKVGVKGAAAFFASKIAAAADATGQRTAAVRAEAGRRREIRAAQGEARAAAAVAAAAQDPKLVRELAERQRAEARQKQEAEEEARRRREEEEASKRRAEFKARNEARFGGAPTTKTKEKEQPPPAPAEPASY